MSDQPKPMMTRDKSRSLARRQRDSALARAANATTQPKPAGDTTAFTHDALPEDFEPGQPKPMGEWTVERVNRYINKAWLANDINAALAAKDELHAAALQVLERHHQKQLTAEREKVQTLVDALIEARENVTPWAVGKIDAELAKVKEGK